MHRQGSPRLLLELALLLTAMTVWRAQAEFEPAPLGPDLQVVETPEVARARAAHLAIHSQLVAASGPVSGLLLYPDLRPRLYSKAPSDRPSFRESSRENEEDREEEDYEDENPREEEQPRVRTGWNGPMAPLSADGRVLDTPEVQAARAAHWAAYQHAMARAVPIGPSEDSSSASM